MIVNQLITQLTTKTDNGLKAFENNLKHANALAERVAGGIARNFKSAGSAINSALKFTLKVNGVGKAKEDVGGLQKMLGGLGALAVGGIGIAGVEKLGSGILEAGKQYENLQAALSTSVGEAGAQKAYAQIENFARRTPYDLNQVAEAFIKLKNLGLDPSEAALTSYGNTAGAMGKPLMQMIEAVADASTGEFERLKEFGIKAKQQGDKVSFTFRGVTTTIGKDSKSIQDYLLKLGNTSFAGGMAKQAGTIGGMTSTLSDNFQALGRAIWTGGVGVEAKKFVIWATEMTDKLLPEIQKRIPGIVKQMTDLAKTGLKLVNDGWKIMQPLLPVINAALLIMISRWAGLKILMAASWIIDAVAGFSMLITAINTGTASMLLFDAAAMAIPVLIGAAVLAVVWFGSQVWAYCTQGKEGIKGLSDQFPWLANMVMWVGDQFKYWWPIIVSLGQMIWAILVTAFKGLGMAVQAMWDHSIGPVFGFFKPAIDLVSKLIWDELIVGGFDLLKMAVNGAFEGVQRLFNFIIDKIPGLRQLVDSLGGSFNMLAGDTPGGDEQTVFNSVGGTNKALQSALVNASHNVKTLRGQCLKAVWQIQQAALGGTSKITAYSAADSANQLANDKRFQEVKVTKAMLNDPKYQQMLNGATVVYDRQAGFSQQHGHIEVLDMVNKTANFGIGPVPLSNRTDQNFAHARVFIPKGQGGQGPVINQVINVPGGDPRKVQAAVNQGTGQALNRAGTSNRQQLTE